MKFKVVSLLAVLLLTIGSFTAGPAAAQTPNCDVSASTNGSATPSVATAGTTVIFRATGFTPDEDVSFWFTTPTGVVIGTASPVPGGVNPDGTVGPLPFEVRQELVNLATGRWAITFQGASSNHVAVIYFCVLTSAQATAVAQPTAPPPTNTAPPAPTNTTVPTAAATSTTVATVEATVTTVATVEATVTAGATAQPTAEATATTQVQPTIEPQPTTPPQPTSAPPAATGSLVASDQMITNNTVIVSSVTASQDGWVVIHESSPDGTIMLPGIIGRTAVRAGTTSNVAIVLDKSVANGAKLWPMLHIDAGTIGAYEFPGADVPVTVNGQIVMTSIFVSTDQMVGMPRTGQNDMLLLLTAVMVAAGLLSIGWMARRRTSGAVR